jgi:hypothetical protein
MLYYDNTRKLNSAPMNPTSILAYAVIPNNVLISPAYAIISLDDDIFNLALIELYACTHSWHQSAFLTKRLGNY